MPKPGHPGHARPAQVMEPPPGHPGELIKQAFGSTEFLEGLGSEQREDERPSLVCAFQHAHRLSRTGGRCAPWHSLFVIWELSKPAARDPALPSQSGDFLAALARERQEFDNATVWPTNLSRGKDNSGELLVIQHAVTSDFLCRQWHAFGWRLIKDGSTHAPAQECLDRLQGLVGGDGSPALFDRRDDLNYISLTDLMNALAGPGFLPLDEGALRSPRRSGSVTDVAR